MSIKIGDTVTVMIPWWHQAKFAPADTGVVKSIMPKTGNRQTYYLVQFANDSIWVGMDRVVLCNS